jgi:hypothetical protein
LTGTALATDLFLSVLQATSVIAVLHKHGLRTAWSDKHPAYDIINGNKPTTQPVNGPGTNADDFFAPEINSDLSLANINLIHSHRSSTKKPAARLSVRNGVWWCGSSTSAPALSCQGLQRQGWALHLTNAIVIITLVERRRQY